jgi:hypothetical protein
VPQRVKMCVFGGGGRWVHLKVQNRVFFFFFGGGGGGGCGEIIQINGLTM